MAKAGRKRRGSRIRVPSRRSATHKGTKAVAGEGDGGKNNTFRGLGVPNIYPQPPM